MSICWGKFSSAWRVCIEHCWLNSTVRYREEYRSIEDLGCLLPSQGYLFCAYRRFSLGSHPFPALSPRSQFPCSPLTLLLSTEWMHMTFVPALKPIPSICAQTIRPIVSQPESGPGLLVEWWGRRYSLCTELSKRNVQTRTQCRHKSGTNSAQDKRRPSLYSLGSGSSCDVNSQQYWTSGFLKGLH